LSHCPAASLHHPETGGGIAVPVPIGVLHDCGLR
jgi:hypothetical protein